MPSNTPLFLEAHFRESIADTFNEAIQQTQSKFSGMGIHDPTWTGETHTWSERSVFTLRESTGQRGGPTQQSEFKAGKRSGFTRSFEQAIFFDRKDADRLNRANLPTSEVMTDLVSAWNRTLDEVFIQASYAQSLGGTAPPFMVAQPLPAHMTIPVNFQRFAGESGSNTGLTIFKIQEAITRMQELEVDLDRDPLILAISPRMRQRWLAYAQSAKNDVFAQMVGAWLKDPKEKVMGCQVIESNRLAPAVSGIQNAVIFSRRGFKTGGHKHTIEIDKLPEQRYATQIALFADVKVAREFDELVKIIPVDLNGVMLSTDSGLN